MNLLMFTTHYVTGKLQELAANIESFDSDVTLDKKVKSKTFKNNTNWRFNPLYKKKLK